MPRPPYSQSHMHPLPPRLSGLLPEPSLRQTAILEAPASSTTVTIPRPVLNVLADSASVILPVYRDNSYLLSQ